MPDKDEILQHHRDGFQDLNNYWDRLRKLEKSVDDFAETALSFVEEPLERVSEKLKAFEPAVSVIGQIKAGKSTLLNALIGQTDLLPSDVNPWTSVITAMHLNSRHRPFNTRAVFRFFDQHEWDRLVATGGRLGEMADRAGFEREADEVRAQVTEMRESTEARLGDEFAKLIGSSHSFPDLDKDTLDRYICYGDPDDLADGAQEGVYADLTKYADLYIDGDHLPSGLCLRDTPGVNDTFMMREQITLNAISDSRVCVVVLSAHQALSTMDLALLRIICSVEAREVLIFVNRIDELPDPEAEKANIRKSIEKTLRRMGVGSGVDILFGSGYWANCALSEDVFKMTARSRASLASLHGGKDTDDEMELRHRAIQSSGITELLKAIAERVVEGPSEAFLKDVRKELNAIIEMSETVESAAANRDGEGSAPMSEIELSMKVADIRDKALTDFDSRVEGIRAELRQRLERAQMTFVDSAVEALQAHLEAFNEVGTWSHDPSGLRMMMKTAYLSMCVKLRREGETSFDQVLDGIQQLLQYELGVFREGNSIEFPEQDKHKSPTVLARTLSIDLQGPWWRKFWRFGVKNAAEKRYRGIIMDETSPLIDDLISDFFDAAVEKTRGVVEDFAMDQGKFCKAVLESFTATPDVLKGTDKDEGKMIA